MRIFLSTFYFSQNSCDNIFKAVEYFRWIEIQNLFSSCLNFVAKKKNWWKFCMVLVSSSPFYISSVIYSFRKKEINKMFSPKNSYFIVWRTNMRTQLDCISRPWIASGCATFWFNRENRNKRTMNAFYILFLYTNLPSKQSKCEHYYDYSTYRKSPW